MFYSCLQNTSTMQDPQSRQPPQTHLSWINNRQVTQVAYATLYKHLPLLFSDCLQLCIYIISSHILAPNVCKCYQDYFQSRPIHSYPSMSSLVYYYTKILLLRNYFYCWSIIEQTSVQNFTCRHTPIHASGNQEQYYIRVI